MTVDKLTVDELTVDELTVDELTVDHLTWYPKKDVCANSFRANKRNSYNTNFPSVKSKIIGLNISAGSVSS